MLTLKCREEIVRTPAIKALNRRDIGKSLATDDEAEDGDPKGEPNVFGANVNASFELRRSGKIVRCVEGAPPVHLRSWKAPRRQLTAAERIQEKQSKRLTLAECVYIFKPLVHLGSCGLFGLNSWKSYSIPLVLDVYR